MLIFKEGQTYICTESHCHWWTEGKEYPITSEAFGRLAITDNRGTLWYEYELNLLPHKFKLKEEKQMLKFKEGQTYICIKSYSTNWIEGNEYKTEYGEISNRYVIYDEIGFVYSDSELNESRLVFKLKEESTSSDLIDNQPHYKNQGIEPIDLMRKNFSKEEFAGFLQGNVLKYMLRYKDKNGLEDLKKAKTYLTWLIEEEQNAKV